MIQGSYSRAGAPRIDWEKPITLSSSWDSESEEGEDGDPMKEKNWNIDPSQCLSGSI